MTDQLSALEARILRATDSRHVRSPGMVAQKAGVREDVALSCLRRLRVREMVEGDGETPRGWLRTYRGDRALEWAE